MSRRALILLLGLAGVIGPVSGALAKGTSPNPPTPGKIAFASDTTPGNSSTRDLFTMNPDGTAVTPLIHSPLEEVDPVFSPDASQIVFSRYPGGGASGQDLWLVNADGSGEHMLFQAASTDPAKDTYAEGPAWSPDGTKIVFVADPVSGSGNAEIFVINVDGSGLTQLTHNNFDELAPDWSPDGQKIVFSRTLTGPNNEEVFTMNADGTGEANLTQDPMADTRPSWSPDGKRIVYAHRTASGGASNEIYVMNADGSGKTPLTQNNVQDKAPHFTDDGFNRILYVEDAGPNGPNQDPEEIFVMNGDGSGQARLTNNATFDGSPRPVPNLSCGGTPATIIGSAAVDALSGGPLDDALVGLGGNDTVTSSDGDDAACGGDGNDSLNGGKGSDFLNGEKGKDKLTGAAGADNMVGEDGKDTLTGAGGSDTENGGKGADLLNGGKGNDLLQAGKGNDTLKGAQGNDVMNGGAGNDKLIGGKGNDTLKGGKGNDVCVTSGNDKTRGCETIR